MNIAITLDIGGSHVTAAAVDLERHSVIEASYTREHIAQDAAADDLLQAWANAAQTALQIASPAIVHHIGIAMPGPFDYAHGISLLQHKFAALYQHNVADDLRTHWAHTALAAMPIQFANDAAAWALGEWWGGAARGLSRVIGITLGTGFGSGFVADGHIVTEGEHVPPGGELWNAPYHGDIAENFVAGAAIQRAYAARTGQQALVSDIEQRASAGDAAAQATFAEMGQHLAHILQPWMPLFQPDGLVVSPAALVDLQVILPRDTLPLQERFLEFVGEGDDDFIDAGGDGGLALDLDGANLVLEGEALGDAVDGERTDGGGIGEGLAEEAEAHGAPSETGCSGWTGVALAFRVCRSVARCAGFGT